MNYTTTATSSSDKFTISQFLQRFPNDDACLEVIKNLRWPHGITCQKCRKVTKHYKVKGRTAYACEFCGNHVYPLAGTVFDKTTTPLRIWFYSVYLMAQTRAGISAKQLQRQIGTTYKTAWRIFHQIRALMSDTDGTPLSGVVEVDETFVGGKASNRRFVWHANEKPKEVVMGMLQRGGKAYFRHVPNTGKWTLLEVIKENVSPNATIYSDEWGGYYHLPKFGYKHEFVNHAFEVVRGEVSTQNLENFWSHLKRGITGVYRKVSKKYLELYVSEFAFRYNNRQANGEMFNLILAQVPAIKMLRFSPRTSPTS